MLGYAVDMGLVTVYACFILPVFSVYAKTGESNVQFGFNSETVTPDIWPDFTRLSSRVFPDKGLLGPSSFSELEIRFPVPFQTWDFMNTGTSFSLNFMNSSWHSFAETNTYQRGELMYLQASASAVPGHKLYIQSCYASSTLDPSNKSRHALILNRGCVSSKRSMMEFVSRQNGSINLILHTSTLKLSQVYVSCSVVLSSYGLSPHTKSCNYKENTSSWVELEGQTSVCDCCATRCRGLHHSSGVHNERTVLVSTGPVMIAEQLQVKQLPLPTASRAGASAVEDSSVSGETPSSIQRGWIVAETSVAGSSVSNVPNSSPWWSQSAVTDGVMVIRQDLGDVLSLLLPGLTIDVQSNPVLTIGVGSPQNTVNIDAPRQSSALTELLTDDYETEGQEEEQKMLSELKLLSQEPSDVLEGYMADAPGLESEELKFGYENETEDFQQNLQGEELRGEGEELRGDVFVNFSSRTRVDETPEESFTLIPSFHMEKLVSPLHDASENEIPEETEAEDEVVVLTQTETIFKKLNGVQLEPLKRSTLTLVQDPDGSRSLSYEEQQMEPDLLDQKVRKTRLDLKLGKTGTGEGRPNQMGTRRELTPSLLDLLRGLNKAVTSVHAV
ncbi:zona pellucida protein C [Brachyhypopomus gauderio]|uniref:zona pellucida protein C n=1 Tax=Brachyhypopomus gauderio TaxID=698409 RepID=UPI00404203E4